MQSIYNLTNQFELDPFDTFYNHNKTAEKESSDSNSDLSQLNLDILFYKNLYYNNIQQDFFYII